MVSGLLQTEDYARALLSVAPGVTAEVAAPDGRKASRALPVKPGKRSLRQFRRLGVPPGPGQAPLYEFRTDKSPRIRSPTRQYPYKANGRGR